MLPPSETRSLRTDSDALSFASHSHRSSSSGESLMYPLSASSSTSSLGFLAPQHPLHAHHHHPHARGSHGHLAPLELDIDNEFVFDDIEHVSGTGHYSPVCAPASLPLLDFGGPPAGGHGHWSDSFSSHNQRASMSSASGSMSSASGSMSSGHSYGHHANELGLQTQLPPQHPHPLSQHAGLYGSAEDFRDMRGDGKMLGMHQTSSHDSLSFGLQVTGLGDDMGHSPSDNVPPYYSHY